MRNKEKKENVIEATIKSIIVAFLYVTIIIGAVYLLFSNSISKAISLIDMVSVQTSKQELKEVKLDLTTKNLASYPDYGSKYGSLKIESLHLDLPLYYGDTLSILRYGIGHSSGSYFPGEGGSILCMGHNYRGVLKTLPEIKIGDKIVIETSYGRYTYQVYDTKIVKDTQIEEAPIQREKEILMLYTCYPTNGLGHAKSRFLTYSNLVQEELFES